MPRCFALVLLALAAGCAGRAKLTRFPDPLRNALPAQRTVALHYDQDGQLYPGGSVPIDSLALHKAGSLYGLFVSECRRTPSEGSPVCAAFRSASGVQWRDGDEVDEALWERVQSGLQDRTAGMLDSITRRPDGGRMPLIVMIHGYNNNEYGPDTWYQALQDSVMKRGVEAAFVRLYWENYTGFPLLTPAFGLDQSLAPTIGIGLRRLLHRLETLEPVIPVRIVTHSLGGVLLANALGDATTPFSHTRSRGDTAFRHYFSRATHDTGEFRWPRLKDLRVGMIVPAASGTTFDAFTSGAAPAWHLTIGYNENDYALTKMGIGCDASGNTCLGADREALCEVAGEDFRDPTKMSARVAVVDFTSPPDPDTNPQEYIPGLGSRGDKHGAHIYLQRKAAPAFLSSWLADGRGPAAPSLNAFCNSVR